MEKAMCDICTKVISLDDSNWVEDNHGNELVLCNSCRDREPIDPQKDALDCICRGIL